MILEFAGSAGKFRPRIRSTGCLGAISFDRRSASTLSVLAASETRSPRQVPALNPIKHRLGSTERALNDVNAQDLTAWAHALNKKTPDRF